MKAERAEQTVASAAWNGGLMEVMIDGVQTRTLGGEEARLFGLGVVVALLSAAAAARAVRRGRNDWIMRIGWRRCVLNRSAKLDGGIVAMGEVW